MIQLPLCIAEEAEACGKIFLHTFLISKKYVPARHEGINQRNKKQAKREAPAIHSVANVARCQIPAIAGTKRQDPQLTTVHYQLTTVH